MKKENKLEGDRETAVDPSLIKHYILNEMGKSMSREVLKTSQTNGPLQKEPQISSSDCAKSQDTSDKEQHGRSLRMSQKKRRNTRGHKIMQSHTH